MIGPFEKAKGITKEQFLIAHIASAICSQLKDNIPGWDYDPISYSNANGELTIRGEIFTDEGDSFVADIPVGNRPIDALKSLLKTICDKVGVEFNESDDLNIAISNIQNR